MQFYDFNMSMISKVVEFKITCHISVFKFFLITWKVDIDFEKEPIGKGKDGRDVYFRDIWPSTEEIAEVGWEL